MIAQTTVYKHSRWDALEPHPLELGRDLHLKIVSMLSLIPYVRMDQAIQDGTINGLLISQLINQQQKSGGQPTTILLQLWQIPHKQIFIFQNLDLDQENHNTRANFSDTITP